MITRLALVGGESFGNALAPNTEAFSLIPRVQSPTRLELPSLICLIGGCSHHIVRGPFFSLPWFLLCLFLDAISSGPWDRQGIVGVRFAPVPSFYFLLLFDLTCVVFCAIHLESIVLCPYLLRVQLRPVRLHEIPHHDGWISAVVQVAMVTRDSCRQVLDLEGNSIRRRKCLPSKMGLGSGTKNFLAGAFRKWQHQHQHQHQRQ